MDGALSIVAAGAAESYQAHDKNVCTCDHGIVEKRSFIGTYATGGGATLNSI
ncbi:hypothetical protein ACFSND_32875 [Brevibacillus brevis]|uniref:hypothetical protein n=1 Tax=Brevibacillus brevis TaxID=1393 RepID=UPI003625E1E6